MQLADQLLEAAGFSTLFVVHVEETFSRLWHRTYLISLRSLIKRSIFNRVIFLNSHIEKDGRMEALLDLRGEDWEWAWGYEPEMFEDQPEEQKWVVPAHQGLYTWVPPQMRGVKQGNFGAVSVLGGAKDECLACWCSVLEHCHIRLKFSPN